jgi:hypothetical protein
MPFPNKMPTKKGRLLGPFMFRSEKLRFSLISAQGEYVEPLWKTAGEEAYSKTPEKIRKIKRHQ